MIAFIIFYGLLFFGGACYCWGHSVAWSKWETWTENDQLSDETKAKINGE